MDEKIMYSEPFIKAFKEDLKKEIYSLDRKPHLVVIQVGNNPASNSYIKGKRKACHEVGISFDLIKYEEIIDEESIINKIKELNIAEEVDGILVQLPLPNHLNKDNIVNSINPIKDVDGLSITNIGLLSSNQEGIIPCTPLGVIKLLKYYNILIEGKNVVIVGRSNLVGRPLVDLFLKEDATVTICHSKTTNLKDYTTKADILVVAVGKRNLITEDMIKDGSIIIDVGINREGKKLYGDVDFNNCLKKAKLITPVPKGIGPITVAMLLNNTLNCYKKNK